MKMPASLRSLVRSTLSCRAAGLKHFRASRNRNTRQFKFLKGCGGQHRNFGPGFNCVRRPSFSFTKPSICLNMIELHAKKLEGENLEIQRRRSANEFAQTIFKLGKSGLHCGFGHGWFSATAEATFYTTFAREQIASKADRPSSRELPETGPKEA